MDAWKTMESAPKDGTIVMLAHEFDRPGDWRIKMGFFSAHENDWHLFGGMWQPTRWQPLPAPPKS